MNSKLQTLLVAAFFWSIAAPVHAAIINVDNGKLLGASGIDVNGVLYDVEFADGACADVFADCGAATGASFVFRTDAQAQAASVALFNQVLIPILDGVPLNSIDGCTAGNRISWGDCYWVTPFALDGSVVSSRAVYMPDPDNPSFFGLLLSDAEFSSHVDENANNFVFAVWTPQDVADAPEPGTLALLGLGLVGMGMRRRIKAS